MTNPFTEIEKQLTEISLKLDALVNPGNNQPEYLTIDQAADFIGLKKSAIYRRTMEGTIPFYKSGRKLMFKRSDMIRFIEDSIKTGIHSNAILIER
jgi:excisionase family DNA binding protein